MKISSNNTKINNPYLANNNVVESKTCAYYNHVNAAMNNDHKLFENEREKKESNDFLFVGWPDIETLEDADHVFRSLDPTFECGAFNNEDEFSWFSSQCIDGSDAVPFDFSSVNLSNDDNCMMISNHDKQTKIHNRSEGLNSFSYLQNGTRFSQSGMKSDSNSVTTLMDDNEFFYGYLKNPDCMNAALYDPTSLSTHVYCSEVENQGEVNGVTKRTLLNLGSLNVPETSCLSFEFDMTSLEASRLCQLQQIMHQLDTRTKICLRDGLYRLARSADQRHSSTSANGRNIFGDTNEMEGTEECNGLMDIETGTNPIDRTIAHLLFHRPTNVSTNSTCDGSSLRSHTMVDGL